MIYLAASIISSSLIFVIFRVAKNYHCRLAPLITVNYLAAALAGILLFSPFHSDSVNSLSKWLPFAALLGILFIVMFFFIGTSSQKAGISVTTLATKLSLVIPVSFSLIFFKEHLTTLKLIGIVAAVVAVGLSVYKKDLRNTQLAYVALPLFIFFGSGIVDSVVKFVQELKIADNETGQYTSIVFLVAFLCGIIYQLFRAEIRLSVHSPTLVLGTLLGLANFGSLYFIIRSLNQSGLKSSLVFALNNMLIVALTTILGTLIFKEKLNKLNFAGIILAIISLYFLL